MCLFKAGFIGNNCEIKDLCAFNVCQNANKCQMIDNNRTNCDCLNGFTGKFCETSTYLSYDSKYLIMQIYLILEISSDNICDGASCDNNGTCYKNKNGSLSCLCKQLFTGNKCEIEIDPCKTFNCSSNGNCKLNETNFPECICNCIVDFLIYFI
jgi:hypothetical protein